MPREAGKVTSTLSPESLVRDESTTMAKGAGGRGLSVRGRCHAREEAASEPLHHSHGPRVDGISAGHGDVVTVVARQQHVLEVEEHRRVLEVEEHQ
jgi:hypothetical protein